MFSDFQSVPVMAGDVLGIFTPNNSRLIPLSETTSSPTNYYLPSGDSEDSSVDIINVQSNIMVEPYRPLVSAFIGEFTSPFTFLGAKHDVCLIDAVMSSSTTSSVLQVRVI